ncbi:hypothetical protein ACFL6I_10695 [candidate division KSB1 bacterium]
MSNLKLFNREVSSIDSAVLTASTAQYGMYATALADSRHARNTFHSIFISIHSVVFAIIGLSSGNGEAIISINQLLIAEANVVGVVMSTLWWIIVMKYREESKVSLKLLSKAEEHLPFNFFRTEYKIKKGSPCIVRKIFKHSEPSIPCIFASIHAVIGLGIWFDLLNIGVAS